VFVVDRKFRKNVPQIPFYSQPQTMEMGKGEAKRMFGIFGNVLEGGGRGDELTPPDI